MHIDHEHAHEHNHTHEHTHGHSHEHSHAHEHPHSHEQEHAQNGGHGDGHGHSHDDIHGHSHDHDHGHSHDHGHKHSHGHDNSHGELPAASAKDLALLKYMLEHNKQHAQELSEMGARLAESGFAHAADMINDAVHYFDHANDSLEIAVELVGGK